MGWLFGLGGLLLNVGKFVGGLFTGGNLESILRTIESGMDDEVTKEQVKADVTKKWIEAQTSLLVGRTWWFQLFFVIPAGIYWSALIFAQFPFLGWTVLRMPGFAEEVFLAIVGALFIVDGGKALLGRFTK
jgi:hypothetical protein